MRAKGEGSREGVKIGEKQTQFMDGPQDTAEILGSIFCSQAFPVHEMVASTTVGLK